MAKQKRDASTGQMQQVMGNLSYAFGWTMAGSAVNDDELDATCANISNTGHGQWAAEGLIPEYIVEPICNSSQSNPNTSVALPWTISYNSDVFTTQLLNSFGNTTNASLTYLCSNLDYTLLDGVHLDETRVITAVCAGAGLQAPPRPEQPPAQINGSVTDAYVNSVSTLYALLFASSGRSNSQLNIYCAHASEYITSLNALQLNGKLVESTICNITQPLSVDAVVSAIGTWSSNIFTTILANAGTGREYLPFVCENVDVDAMNSVGLDGSAVHSHLCIDAFGSGSFTPGVGVPGPGSA